MMNKINIYFLAVIIFATLIYGASYIDNIGLTLGSSDGSASAYGIYFEVNQTINITNATTHASTTCNRALLWYGNSSLIEYATVRNHNINFTNATILVQPGTTQPLILGCDSSGAGYTRRFENNGDHLPTYGQYTQFLIGSYSNTANHTTVSNFMTVGYEELNASKYFSVTFEAPTPGSGTKNNTQITINVSCYDLGNLVTLYFDQNPTPITTVIDNEASPADYTTSVTATGTYYYMASCEDGNVNSSIRTWLYDNTKPTATLGANNIFTADNTTIDHTYNLTLNLTLSDDLDLYAFQIQINRTGYGNYYTYTNSTLSGTMQYFYNSSNSYAYPNGEYNAYIFVSDSHTAQEIKPYNVEKRPNELVFNTEENNIISIRSEDTAIVEYSKTLDRYRFHFDFSDHKSATRVFYIECDGKLYPKYQDTKLTAHFICSKDGLTGNWIDLEGTGIKPAIVKISASKYKITFINLPTKVEFNSIGGLNVESYAYSFTLDRAGLIDNCSNSYAIPSNATTLNITFRDLNTQALTPVNLTLTLLSSYTNYTVTNYYTTNQSICIYPKSASDTFTVQYKYQFQGSYNYYDEVLTLSNITTQKTLYTQSATDEVTFTVKDRYTGQAIPNAYISMYVWQDLTYTIIASKYTDITGQAVFNYLHDTKYQFYVSISGYESYNFILDPIISDTYTIKLTKAITINETIDYDRVLINYDPTVFYDGANNTFTFSIVSPYAELVAYGFSLSTPLNSISDSGANSAGQIFTQDISIVDSNINDRVTLYYYYRLQGQDLKNFTLYYPIMVNITGGTMMGLRDNTYGLGLFERALIMTAILILVVGVASLIGQIVAGTVLGGAVMGFLSYIGFVPLWLILLPITLILFLIAMGSNN